ncbi:MAG: SGNH/GDSL hydrolase family protein, partial [Chloroflexi bacterium]
MNYWLGFGVIFIIVAGVLAGLLFLVRYGMGEGRVRRWLENGLLALLAVFFTLMALELGFKLFFAQSDGFRYTLASKNWYARYWQENSLGYRDREWTPQDVAGKTKVMVVGDSFVAGSGIANPEDRFSNQLGRLLGDEYVVFNVSSPGWDTADEI